ncbi:TlpA family protein disulfide reductase [Flammeovirga pectinis]|uniref:TlpA family protein disulfide reductase n=1 Tax=Flammeovirga pectinis TaxID=2494373 RepID=A0A3S9P7F3_9BACT|nr:TlpA disulfide reductase family protein [Flammeovirga pectinis]AZQ64139.1 TlpA family protein disulfide reductase [Flammeovirga pectinis]
MKITKKFLLKELKSWGIFVAIIGTLYFTGLLTDVAGTLQRFVVATGIVNADTEQGISGKADYNWVLKEFESGKQVKLSDFKGKMIFLNIWASWCPPCIAEMPSIQSLYDQLKNREDVVFILLNVDEDKMKASKFLKRKDYTFPIYQKVTSVPSIFYSNSIPSTYVINKDGEVIYNHQGLANYDSESFINMLTSD